MPKKLSDRQKSDMVKGFISGETIDQLTEKYQITKVTITRHLKKEVDPNLFKTLIKNIKLNKKTVIENNKKNKNEYFENSDVLEKKVYTDASFNDQTFFEITPLDYIIDHQEQKDLSSVSIAETDLPQIVYMIVDNKIELETKLLKEYPNWQFLSESELNRKTIEIYFDIKIAKKFCRKDQKVLKVPNTKVFSLAAPTLISRGISRIVCPDKLIAL